MEPALDEFRIQEAGIEKGQVEFEYRGAYHWGGLRRGHLSQPNENHERQSANYAVRVEVLLGVIRRAIRLLN
jgi:hypothetical protein